MVISEQLANSYQNGFIDCNLKSLERYNPKLLTNDSARGTKVLSSIQSELRTCQEFWFSVAFITESGLQVLLNTLDELREKGISGKIVTSQYQDFTQPKALRRLLGYENIQLRIVIEENFHAKGYIFKHSENYSFIIGSSNLTQNALGYNKEWNLKLNSLEDGAVMKNIIREFDYTFENAVIVTDDWIDEYQKIYSNIRRTQEAYSAKLEGGLLIPFKKVNPNKMQEDAIRHLRAIHNDGKNRALIISATGTGKTYLSAFDVAEFKPKKFLFVVHRENILKSAMSSFKKVLGYNIDAGILSGNQKNYNCDYTFATVQTISQEIVMKQFGSDFFDYIVIDEVHRAGGETYKKIIDYFNPKFLLGMTATPERTDGYDIFKAFNYNIAYEIRLHNALEQNMLSPFHYFGVTEISVDGQVLNESANFSSLVCEERVNRIIEASQHYSHYGDRLRGLIFCSRVDEAELLSEKLNNKGYSTIALSGKNSERERENAIQRLEQETFTNGLDYILTVDIFNEGIDIPSINQIIMLRPTQSAIVFVQQLGRGLRKVKGKEFLTVIDFIGNYSNNYLVPIALYGDRTNNKDSLRKLMNGESVMIPGCSTVNFDKITKERIYSAIDVAKLSTLRDLKKDYQLMKYRLGRPPMMMDFLEQGERDPYSYIEYSKTSYYDFVKKIDPDSYPPMTQKHQNLLSFYSKEILNGKRLDEVILLALLMQKGKISREEFYLSYEQTIKTLSSEETLISSISNLNGQFIKDSEKEKYGIDTNIGISGLGDNKQIFMSEEHRIVICEEPLRSFLQDMISYAFKKFRIDYISEDYRSGLQLYKKYSRKDVCRILNWNKNEESTIYGYRIKHNTCPIFITYHKSEKVSESQNYNDHFINSNHFSWMTRSRVRMDSREVVEISKYRTSGLRISLFIKKSDGEGTDFYYMGDVEPIEFKETKLNGAPIVNILFKMKDEVEEGIYNYFEGMR